MSIRRFLLVLASVGCVTGLAAGAFFSRDRWITWVMPAPPAAQTHEEEWHPGEESQLLEISPQARKNLGLVSRPVQLETYWRTVLIPGQVIDPPGLCDRSVAAPIPGILTHYHARPGDLVRPGDPLATLQLVSDPLRNLQGDLFKATREMRINREQQERLAAAVKRGAVPEAKLIELDNQHRLLSVTAEAARRDLLARGLTALQIEQASQGTYVGEVIVYAAHAPHHQPTTTAVSATPASDEEVFDVQELNVQLGEQVQAGQTLCVLADHQELLIEGRAFRREVPRLEQALRDGWPVRVEFTEEPAAGWPPLDLKVPIRHFATTVDPDSQTLPFYLSLANQSRTYLKEGRTYLLWRFRPGQRVRLHVPVEEMRDVIVLPAGAVHREGPEAFVFRQNGDLFDRRAVHVLHEDRLHVVLANDGSITPGMYLAQSAAAALNRVLKAQNASGGLPPGAHFHADGSLHIPGH